MEDTLELTPTVTVDRLSGDLADLCCTGMNERYRDAVTQFWQSVNTEMDKHREMPHDSDVTYRNNFGVESSHGVTNNGVDSAEKYFRAVESYLYDEPKASGVMIRRGDKEVPSTMQEITEKFIDSGKEHLLQIQSGKFNFYTNEGNNTGSSIEIQNGTIKFIQEDDVVLTIRRSGNNGETPSIEAELPFKTPDNKAIKIIHPVPYGVIQNGLLFNDTMPIGIVSKYFHAE